MFRLDEERVIDATLSGGLARYINHSCNPNCVAETVEVDRDFRIIIFAKRRINRGEEVSHLQIGSQKYTYFLENFWNGFFCLKSFSFVRWIFMIKLKSLFLEINQASVSFRNNFVYQADI